MRWQARRESNYPGYIPLGIHKDRITVAVARADRNEPESKGEFANKRSKSQAGNAFSREFNGEVLLFCYKAETLRLYGYIGNYWNWIRIGRWPPPSLICMFAADYITSEL